MKTKLSLFMLSILLHSHTVLPFLGECPIGFTGPVYEGPELDYQPAIVRMQPGGDLMLVSQFTLAAETEKGLRPGFSTAKPPAEAEVIYDKLVQAAQTQHEFVQSGKFGADMQVSLENDGPVTFILRV